jgi:hypothetical protein
MQAPQPAQHPDAAPLRDVLTCPGSENPRIPGAWSHQDLKVLKAAWLPGAPTHSGSQNPRITGSQRQLDSEEFWHNQDHRKDRLQSDISKAGSTSDNQMAGVKLKNISNRNQGYLASSEPNSPTIASPGYPDTPVKQDSYLKSLLMMMIEDIKKDINNSLKEIQENTGKRLEALKEETQKSLKELQENTIKQVKERNKNFQDLKNETRNNKESTKGDNPRIRKPRKKIKSHRCKPHQQNTRDRRKNLRCRRYHRKHWHNSERKCKKQKAPNPKHPEIQDTMRRPNLRIIGIEESEDSQRKGPVNIFNKIKEENFLNLKREMPMNLKEAYRSPNRSDQKKNFPVT